MVKRGEVWLVILDPAVGRAIQKTRPCVVISPPEINDHLGDAYWKVGRKLEARFDKRLKKPTEGEIAIQLKHPRIVETTETRTPCRCRLSTSGRKSPSPENRTM